MVAIRCVVGLAIFVSAAPAERVTFSAVRQELIENRLRSAPKKQADRQPALEEMFREAGCSDGLTTQAVKGEKYPNVVCTLAGSGPGQILVGAHFDLKGSDGVVDNWSGAALLPTLFQSLKSNELRHTFVFVGFTAEERGLVGSASFVKHNNLENARAMINLDTLGLSDTKVWVSHADPTLLRYLGEIAKAAQMPLAGVDVEKVGSTDSESFRNKKIPALTLHSITQETMSILHTSKDRIEAVDFEAYQRSYRLIALYLAYLDRKLD